MNKQNAIGIVVISVITGPYGLNRLEGQSPQNPAESREAVEKRQRSPEVGKRLLKNRPSKDLVEWDFDGIPKDIKVNVDNYFFVMQEHAVPHKTTRPFETKDDLDLLIRVFAASNHEENDLIEYQWSHAGLPVRVVQSLNALRVDFDLDQLPECRQRTRGQACVAAARHWVEQVIRLEGGTEGDNTNPPWRVNFPWPAEFVDGAWFSSAPEENIVRLSGPNRLHKRIDAFVEAGHLSLLFYKKIPQLTGYADGSKWFPEDFRASVHQRARQQGKP